jgi:asparagine synthase (glutamine-hydrolysing)
MSGVLGIAGARGRQSVGTILNGMARALCHREWYTAETYADEQLRVGLGRTGIGIFNREPQPFADGEARVAFMAGVLFDAGARRRELERKGYELTSGTDLELLLRLYQDRGPDFCSDVAGEFVVAVWDRDRRELIVCNDRLGLYPTYYAGADGRFLFAPEMKAILRAPDFGRRLDSTALAEYMRFQCLLGDRTFFENVLLLPNASVLRFHVPSASLTVRPYWKLSSIVAAPRVRFEEAVEESGRLLSIAVNRMPSRGFRTGLYLSGGLDSRLLLGLFDGAYRPVTAFTFGQRRCHDVVYGRRLARIAGADHHWFPLESGAWVAEWAPFHVQLTEGLHSWVHAHGISTLPEARRHMEVAITGWDGGTVVGHWLGKLPGVGDPDDLDVVTARQFQLFQRRYTWPGLDEGEARVLFAPKLAEELRDRAFESLRREVAVFMECRADLREELLYIRNHCFRLTSNIATMLRSHIDVCSPFFDFDLFRFIYSLPAALRGYKLLERALLQKFAPWLCYVLDPRTNMLPTTHSVVREGYGWAYRVARGLRTHLFGARGLHPLYADYERYLRTDLHDWGKDLLLGRRTLERGIFNPTLLHSLWQRMQSGREPDLIGKLAPVMSYELMLRSLVDE